jgi:hypothetical protein
MGNRQRRIIFFSPTLSLELAERESMSMTIARIALTMLGQRESRMRLPETRSFSQLVESLIEPLDWVMRTDPQATEIGLEAVGIFDHPGSDDPVPSSRIISECMILCPANI